MYIKKTFYTGKIIEIEKIFTFRYKGKKTTRGANTQTTNEKQAKVNERNAAKRLRRLINTNFNEDSYHVVLTYDPAKRAECPEEAKRDLANFWRRMKTACKKAGTVLKYICVSEYGAKSMHHHCVLDCGLDVKVIQACWVCGRIKAFPLDDTGDYSKLAGYLIKQTCKTFRDPEKCVHKKRYCCSKNLVQPEMKVEVVKADSWREDPVVPKGWSLVKDSLDMGVSEETGYPYQYYALIKLEEKFKRKGGA